MKRKNTIKEKICKIIIYLLLFISILIFSLTNYISKTFSNVSFEQILFTISSAQGTSSDVILNGLLYVLKYIGVAIIFIILLKVSSKVFFNKTTLLSIKIGKKKICFSIIPLSNVFKIVFFILILLFTIIFAFFKLDIYNYLKYNVESDFIEKNYVNPKKVEITAPKQKQNLIFIYVESLESTLVTEKNNGAFKNQIIPNLEDIALNNINFSNNNGIGGAFMAYGASWTIAGMTGSSSGLPIKIPIDANAYKNYGEFLPGAYSLGEILKDNGYNNYLLLGSDATFGGRKDYFSYHGNYNIYDYIYAKENSWIDEDYCVWWGYEDSKLYDFAKEELTNISKNDKPFNFTILTADTHFIDGYVDEQCPKFEGYKYLNAYNCTDYLLSNFIKWIENQEFYKNTTIVIVGDHLTMQSNFTDMFEVKNKSNYTRTIYNAFINSRKKANNNICKNRTFNTFDFYPTTLSSLGFNIKGDKLALGTDLFSGKKTLTEKYGVEEVNEELKKKSTFYNKKLLGSTYEKMKQGK